VGMARSLARELGSRNITVNVVAPGFADTDMTAALGEDRQKAIVANVPLGRTASADEVAGVVQYLAGPDAAYITGAVIPVAGRVGEHVDRLDGVVHGIAFAPSGALGGNFLNTTWEDVATAVQVSTYSLKALAMATLPLMQANGGALVGMDFDASRAWPAYDW